MSRPPRRRGRDVLKLSDFETLRFLELYRLENVLYDITLADYRNRDLRLEAANRIASSFGVAGFGSAEVLMKFKNLRNAYSQELKKIEENKVDGDPYVPKVHWFSMMNSFLRPFIYQRPTPTSAGSEASSSRRQLPTEESRDPLQLNIKEEEIDIEDHHLVETPLNPREPLRGPFPGTSSFQSVGAPNLTNIINNNLNRSKRKADSSVEDGLRNGRLRTSVENPLPIAATKPRQEFNPNAPRSVSLFKGEDMYDHFGSYIASLLRSVGNPPKALKVQQEVLNLVMNRITQEDDNNTNYNLCESSRTSSTFETSETATDALSPANNGHDCS